MYETPERKQLVISCGMLSDELKRAYRVCNSKCDIVWTKRALHKHPKSLRDTLMSIIDEHQNQDDILLTYGLCGNGTIGIKSEHTRLVIPRFHDCIHQLIQSVDNYTTHDDDLWKIGNPEINVQKQTKTGHLYLTRSWTLDQEAICQQSRTIIKTYGKYQGQEILDEMYGDYTDIDVIDTDSYDVLAVLQYAKDAAQMHNLNVNQIKGCTLILEKLLRGEWDSDFIVLEPGQELKQNHFFNI